MSRGLPYDSAPGARLRAAPSPRSCAGWAYRTSAQHRARRDRPVRRLRREQASRSSASWRSTATTSTRSTRALVPYDLMTAARDAWDETHQRRPRARLPQRPGHRAGADRHHRLHDGLRHHRHRAGHRARQVQAPGRRRHAQDRQQHGRRGAGQARLRRGRSARRIVEYIDAKDTIEGAPGPQGRAPAGVRLRLPRANGTRSIHYMGHIR